MHNYRSGTVFLVILASVTLLNCSSDENGSDKDAGWTFVNDTGSDAMITTDANGVYDASTSTDASTYTDAGTSTDASVQPDMDVPVDCALFGDVCESEGSFQCADNGARLCARSADGCLLLAAPQSCETGNICVDAGCSVEAGCSAAPNVAPCDDADLTTSNDTCANGTCAGEMIACVATQCMVSSTPNGVDCDVQFRGAAEACDDGDLATANDHCDGAGACVGAPIMCVPTQCDASATPNGTDCVRVAKAAGDSCNDGDLTTGGDICDGMGACKGSPIMCVPGTCEASSTPNGVGCDVVLLAVAAACNDGNPATNNDICDANGSCTGTPYSCTPGVCESSSTPDGSGCSVAFAAPGTGCNDNNLATGSDQCNGAGACAGTPIVCTPRLCEVSSTPNGVDCTVGFTTANTACNDNSLSTASDVCNGAGTCAGTPIVCPANQCITSSVPNGVNCTTVFKTANTVCNDNNLSTRNDVCNGAGTCAGQPYTCPSAGICQLSNNPNGVGCTLVNQPNGSNCSDNETCTVNDRCVAGACVGTSLCGNGTCDVICGENAGTCSQDCLTTVGMCNSAAGENACNDWADCHSNTTGNGLCANIGCGGGQVGNCFCGLDCINFGDCCQDMAAVCGCN